MGLILIMLYENQLPNSRWKSYLGIEVRQVRPDLLDVLPTAFDTPMFWNEEELMELKGTEVPSRIGKAKSEEQYRTILLPIINANSALFNLEKCGLDTFHQMGSLVLAYSFGRSDHTHDDDDDDEIDQEEKNDIAMVPLADMLNANPQLNNVLPTKIFVLTCRHVCLRLEGDGR
jgi:N-lysine methyltransferase SETD6